MHGNSCETHASFESYVRELSLVERAARLSADYSTVTEHCTMVLFVGSDMMGSFPDHEVLVFAEQMLWEREKSARGRVPPTPDKRRVLVSNCKQLDSALTTLSNFSRSGNTGVALVALGHYAAVFEREKRYHFVAETLNDATYFGSVVGRFSVISSFWALGCVTARSKFRPDLTGTNFCNGNHHSEDGTQHDISGTLVFTVGGSANKVLAQKSFLYQVALSISATSRQQPLLLRGEMQLTVPMLENPETGEIRFVAITTIPDMAAIQSPRSAPYVNHEKLLDHHKRLDQVAGEVYPMRVEWMWSRDEPFGGQNAGIDAARANLGSW